MTREEYNELRARAHEQMLDDYKWMLDQESGIREWRCPKRWIIEFVHDVSDYVMVRSSGEEDVGDEWHDDLLRPHPPAEALPPVLPEELHSPTQSSR